jgi:hypothetical protein
MTFEQATPEWREKRAVLTRNLNPKNLDERHFKVQEAEYEDAADPRVFANQSRSVVFLNRVLEHPDQIYDYARLYASSVAAILAWGLRAKDFESFFFKNFYDFVDQVRSAHRLPRIPWLY